MQNGKQCPYCGKKLADSAYFKSFNPKHKDGLTPICKKCFVKNSLDVDGQDIDLAHFQQMLQLCDKPYKPEIYKAAMSQAGNYGDKAGKEFVTTMIGLYMAKLNLHQYKGLTWEDSTFTDGKEDSKEAEYVDNSQLFSQFPGKIRRLMQSLYDCLQVIYDFTDERAKGLLATYVEWRITEEILYLGESNLDYEGIRESADYELVKLKELFGTEEDRAFAEFYKKKYGLPDVSEQERRWAYEKFNHSLFL